MSGIAIFAILVGVVYFLWESARNARVDEYNERLRQMEARHGKPKDEYEAMQHDLSARYGTDLLEDDDE